jgi:hypothetical protein
MRRMAQVSLVFLMLTVHDYAWSESTAGRSYEFSVAAYLGLKPDGIYLEYLLPHGGNLERNLKTADTLAEEGEWEAAELMFTRIRRVEERAGRSDGFARAVVRETRFFLLHGKRGQALATADELFDREQYEDQVSHEYVEAFSLIGDALVQDGEYLCLRRWLEQFMLRRFRSPFHWFRHSHPNESFMAEYGDLWDAYHARAILGLKQGAQNAAGACHTPDRASLGALEPTIGNGLRSVVGLLIAAFSSLVIVELFSRTKRGGWRRLQFLARRTPPDVGDVTIFRRVAEPIVGFLTFRYNSLGIFLLTALITVIPLATATSIEGTFMPIPEVRQTYLRAFGDWLAHLFFVPLMFVIVSNLYVRISAAYERFQSEWQVPNDVLDTAIKRSSRTWLPGAAVLCGLAGVFFLWLKWKSYLIYGVAATASGPVWLGGVQPTPAGMYLALVVFLDSYIVMSAMFRWWLFSDALGDILEHVRPNPLHPDRHGGLKFVGDLCLLFYLLLGTTGLCLVILTIQDRVIHNSITILLTVILIYVIASPVVVFLPIYHTHRMLVAERSKRLSHCSMRLRSHTSYSEDLARLRCEYELIASSSAWPINLKSATGIAAAVVFQVALPSLVRRLMG